MKTYFDMGKFKKDSEPIKMFPAIRDKESDVNLLSYALKLMDKITDLQGVSK